MTPTEAMPALPELPECFEFAMSFVGDPDESEIRKYISKLRTDLEASRLECERLRVDAERWRFYDKFANDWFDGKQVGVWLILDGIMRHGSRNAAIDFAMKKERT